MEPYIYENSSWSGEIFHVDDYKLARRRFRRTQGISCVKDENLAIPFRIGLMSP